MDKFKITKVTNKKHRIYSFLVIFLLMSVLFRIDFRFKTTVECCSDDYDYFLHSSTIALDFDLDYQNQNPRAYSYKQNDKNTPVGFFGSGILSSPFLFAGDRISTLINEDLDENILNYKLLLYSLSPIFYLFFGYILIYKSLIKLNFNFNKYFLMLIYIASGVGYYAFERFSMTHAFEVFSISLIIYSSIRFYQEKNNSAVNRIGLILPFTVLLSYLIRMSNIYIFLLPLLIRNLMQDLDFKISNKMLTNKYVVSSIFLTTSCFAYISNVLYGQIIINPQKIYGSSISLTSEIFQLKEFIITFLNTLFTLLFSLEFGLFWLSPILFCGLIYIFLNIRDFFKIEYQIILFAYFQNIIIIYLWQAAGSSYGYRYLFSLTPLAIIIHYKYLNRYIYIKKYLLLFSVFSLLSLIFFETTSLTQLSVNEITNSFGRTIRYSQPEYVKGLVLSFFNFQSYLIIFTTSFLGVIVFKFLFLFINFENLLNILEKLNLPVSNSDFQNYIVTVYELELHKILTILLFIISMSFVLTYKIESTGK